MIEVHRFLADHCCQNVLAAIEKPDRSRSETMRMLHEAHAACYHIEHVGSTANLARCEWLLSRAYHAAAVGERALTHAERALDLSDHPDVDDMTRALCLDACARAHRLLGRPVDADYCRQEALLMAARIPDENDRRDIIEEIQSCRRAM